MKRERKETNLGISQHFLHGRQTLLEEALVQLLETGARDGCRKIDSIKQGINLNCSLRLHRQDAFGTLTRGAESSHGTFVAGNILVVEFSLDFINEIIDHTVIKILAAQVAVSPSHHTAISN